MSKLSSKISLGTAMALGIRLEIIQKINVVVTTRRSEMNDEQTCLGTVILVSDFSIERVAVAYREKRNFSTDFYTRTCMLPYQSPYLHISENSLLYYSYLNKMYK